MAKKQDPRITRIIQLIRDFNGDTKQPVAKTLEGLEAILDEAELLSEPLRESV